MGFSAVEAFPKCNILSVNDTSRKAPYPVFSPSPFPNPPKLPQVNEPPQTHRNLRDPHTRAVHAKSTSQQGHAW